jgi:glutathione S-transferase
MVQFLIRSKHHRFYLILSVLGLVSSTGFCSHYPSFVVYTRQKRLRRLHTGTELSGTSPSWAELENELGECFRAPASSVSIDSVLDPDTPTFSTERPTLFRERHGWCPYSERVWLTLELNDISHDTIRIDNSGGPRPSYYDGGQTPQMKWPEGKLQGESMDLVYDLDSRYECQLQSNDSQVKDCIAQFRSIFPRARPSSRAAFLFQYNGDPLSRGTFETTLQQTDNLLSQSKGSFFCGDQLTAADIAWAPFLERYRYQLPCLHQGLEPYNANVYPHLFAWYHAMDQVPAYACRVKGDASSWRKVLTMAGFGNAGVPVQVGRNIQDLVTAEVALAASGATIDLGVWNEYSSTRPHVADTPQGQAALTILCNRDAIIRDTVKRAATAPWSASNLPKTETRVEETLKGLVQVLLNPDIAGGDPLEAVGALAGFLDERMCVPRDMGAMSAACLKKVAGDLQ